MSHVWAKKYARHLSYPRSAKRFKTDDKCNEQIFLLKKNGFWPHSFSLFLNFTQAKFLNKKKQKTFMNFEHS